MDVRLRIPELLKERDLSPYAVAKQSDGRISMSTAYRLVKLEGRVQTFDAGMLEALCDIFEIEPGELLEREGKRRRAR